MMTGVYEQLINNLISKKLNSIKEEEFYIKTSKIEKNEASLILTQYLSKIIHFSLNSISGEDSIENQIQLINKIIYLLKNEIEKQDFTENILDINTSLLTAILPKIDSNIVDFEKHLKEITPYTGLTQSELFTGSNTGISLESELRKEILSSNEIYFLVSFIKWAGIRIFEKELREFTSQGKKLKIITTSYMGATDLKAVEFLSSLPNTEVKVSYNTANERLHAKSYLFFRDTGFHTGYIGSSNISKSALTSGLEWNLKVTTSEISHVIDKFKKTFDTYWEDKEFETFTKVDTTKLHQALKSSGIKDKNIASTYFELKPFHYQEEILEQLEAQRKIHNRFKNLIVAATGTGKTVISAFDYKRFKNLNSKAKLLFVAHRKEILKQALATFRGVLRDNNFGELWVDGETAISNEHLFVSVQTLQNNIGNLNLSKEYYDFIIIDEVHHISANSYRPILEKFNPKILLGLTATPERMDNENILSDFCDVIASEIRLPEALNRKLLCPFQYFGISDSIDLKNIKWQNGKYSPTELTEAYNKGNRVGEIISKCEEYLTNINEVIALGFCVSKEHAKFMSEKFNEVGLKSNYLVSGDTSREIRDNIKRSLVSKEINYLFVVDIFNEGVDIPQIDTILFLRPTESLTVFLQQLGRGLRFSDNKECLTVLDFVGNARDEYDFEGKFRSIIGKTNNSVKEEIENEFPHLPLGCSIILEKKAKEHILSNIKKATILGKNKLINKIINYKNDTHLPLNISNFLQINQIEAEAIYKRGSFSSLCFEAGVIKNYDGKNEIEFVRTILKKWLLSNSLSYFEFIKKLIENNFDLSILKSENEKLMLMMFYYDFWQKPKLFNNLEESIKEISLNEVLIKEMKEIIEILIDKINYIEKDIVLPYNVPIKLHSRYTREQILSAFGLNTLTKQYSSREGVLNIKEKNTELLFVTLEKTEDKYSPTTMYDDYAISEKLFHWQSQNSTKPDSPKGKSYINHEKEGKNIVLFVRESNHDKNKNTMTYICLGKVFYKSHYGSQPMSINWELEEEIPPFLWKNIAKMAVG
ncbi:type III restriction protein res subunit [Arcobacter nitrofigilis DSM 7299]|uniref:Type III restriction protein res subunit n=1 Tax=Arcobacter nitrofigilis (strain ATCC 33309 / DSM 7299 / CCUG 15893 / LMG 7604 / NCTC 12251 / CI) TaxID=572480 RepID=D5V6X1_ARCNC|nr:DEAD/DEAH box helicase [Arcobacter nitrofigilis]ADG94391.1 type III restriction protein res subunit [Arcobacter nitrofigilis DSM 7299]